MKDNKMPIAILQLVIGIIALVFIFISIFFKKGNNIFLDLGLIFVIVSMVLNWFTMRKNK